MHTWHLARGYRYAGVHCGLRPDPDRRDLALVVSDIPAAAAGVFTQNRVCAAPVHICRERLPAADVARRRHLLRQRQRLHRRSKAWTTPAA